MVASLDRSSSPSRHHTRIRGPSVPSLEYFLLTLTWSPPNAPTLTLAPPCPLPTLPPNNLSTSLKEAMETKTQPQAEEVPLLLILLPTTMALLLLLLLLLVEPPHPLHHLKSLNSPTLPWPILPSMAHRIIRPLLLLLLLDRRLMEMDSSPQRLLPTPTMPLLRLDLRLPLRLA